MTEQDAPPPRSGQRDRRRPHPMPRARFMLMVLIVLSVLAGFASLVWLIAELRLLMDKARIPTQQDLERSALAFKILAAVMSVSLLEVAAWIAHFAWRIQRDAVYPPPGSRQLRVRRVRHGKQALHIAYFCYAAAAALAAIGISLTPVALRIMATLGL